MCSIQLSVTMVASGGTWTMGIQRCTEFKVCHMRAAIRESGLKRLFIPSLRPPEGKNPLQDRIHSRTVPKSPELGSQKACRTNT
jgi:hypothetical protein